MRPSLLHGMDPNHGCTTQHSCDTPSNAEGGTPVIKTKTFQCKESTSDKLGTPGNDGNPLMSDLDCQMTQNGAMLSVFCLGVFARFCTPSICAPEISICARVLLFPVGHVLFSCTSFRYCGRGGGVLMGFAHVAGERAGMHANQIACIWARRISPALIIARHATPQCRQRNAPVLTIACHVSPTNAGRETH